MSLAGSMSRQQETEVPMGPGHVVNLGRLIEDMENRMRSTIDSVYFGKTREVVAHLRASDGVMAVERRQSAQTGIVADMLKKQSLGGGAPPPGGVGLPGMMGLPGGFDPKAGEEPRKESPVGTAPLCAKGRAYRPPFPPASAPRPGALRFAALRSRRKRKGGCCASCLEVSF